MDIDDRMLDAIRSALRAGTNEWLHGDDPRVLRRLCQEARGYADVLGGFLSRVESVLDRSFGDAVEYLSSAGRGIDADQLTKIAEESFTVSPRGVDEIFSVIKKGRQRAKVHRICASLATLSPEGYETPEDVFADLELLRALDGEDGVEASFFETCQKIDDLGDTSQPKELVKDLLFEETFAIIGGDPKAGKTTLALQIALCVVTGLPFFGRAPSKTGPAVLLQADMGAGYFRHVVSELGRGLEADQFDHPIHYRCSTGVNLAERSTRSRVLSEIRRLNPVLIVADPLRDLHGGNEDKSEEIKPVLDFFLELRDTTRSTVIVIDHLTKPQEASKGGKRPAGYSLRGSGAKYGRADSILIVRDQGQGLSRVEITHRYGATPPPVFYTREPRESGFRLVQACHIEVDSEGESAPVARETLLDFLGKNYPTFLSKNSIVKGSRLRKQDCLAELSILEDEGMIETDGEPMRVRKFRLMPEHGGGSGGSGGSGNHGNRGGSGGSRPPKGEGTTRNHGTTGEDGNDLVESSENFEPSGMALDSIVGCPDVLNEAESHKPKKRSKRQICMVPEKVVPEAKSGVEFRGSGNHLI